MKKILITSLLSISLFVICLFLAWKSLSATNFFFERLYQLHAIDEQIKNYAPQNRNKENFELTSSLEHQRIFGEIVSSINSNGKGLAEISYFDPSGDKIDEFLTNDEIIHLKDVSELIVSSTQIVLILTRRFNCGLRIFLLLQGKPLQISLETSYYSIFVRYNGFHFEFNNWYHLCDWRAKSVSPFA